MILILAILCKIIGSSLVEYRFGTNYGNKFWDYSGNQNIGLNAGTVSDIKYTNRGLYLHGKSSSIITSKIPLLSSTYSILGWVCILNDKESESLFFRNDKNHYFALGRDNTKNALQLSLKLSNYFGKISGTQNSFSEGVWTLLTLSYDSLKFEGYINGQIQLSFLLESVEFNSDIYMGLGTLYKINQVTRTKSVVWNYIVLNGFVSFPDYISKQVITSCIVSPCSPCNPAIIDPEFGTGCIDGVTSYINNTNTYNDSCASYGCTHTVEYSCESSKIYEICIYTYFLNKCYKMTSSGSSLEVPCSCRTGFISVNNQCCNPGCTECDSLGDCSCPPGQYAYSTSPTQCCTLGSGCYKCNATNQCLACALVNAVVVGSVCECAEGFYKNEATCFACGSGCKTCTTDSSCSECFDQSSLNSNGSCICGQGYFDSLSKSCKPCSALCQNCTSNSNCFECSDLNSDLIQGTCTCKNGYYLVSSSCLPCGKGCQSCTSMYSCISCYDQEAVIVDGNCLCSSGYFDTLLLSCLPCGKGCKKCSSKNSCLECFNNNTEVSGGDCYCGVGYYETFNQICLPCEERCKTCTFDMTCLTCKKENMIVNNTSCICRPGFYEIPETGLCEKCSEGCEACLNSSFCVSCKQAEMDLVQGTCICKDRYFMDSGACSGCNALCAKCDKNQCFFCVDPNSFLDANNECKCNENASSCLSLCTSFSEKNCTSCSNHAILTEGNCMCEIGYKVREDSCVLSTFTVYLMNTLQNNISLEFSEPLNRDLETSDIKIRHLDNYLAFHFSHANQTWAYIVFDNFTSFHNGDLVEILFVSKLTSVFSSTLEDSVYNISMFETITSQNSEKTQDRNEYARKGTIVASAVIGFLSLVQFDPKGILGYVTCSEINSLILLYDLNLEDDVNALLHSSKLNNLYPGFIDASKIAGSVKLDQSLLDFGFKSNLVFLNLFNFLVLSLGYGLTYFFLIRHLIKKFQNRESLKDLFLFLKYKVFFIIWLRYFLETFISCLISLTYVDGTSWMFLINFTIAYILIILQILFFAVFLYFVILRYKTSSEDLKIQIDEALDFFFDGLKKEKIGAGLFFVFFFARRAVLAFLVFFVNKPDVKLMGSLMVSLSVSFKQSLFYLFEGRYHSNFFENILHFSNELATLLLHSFILSWRISRSSINDLGQYVQSVLTSVWALNIICLLGKTVSSIYEKCKEWIIKKKITPSLNPTENKGEVSENSEKNIVTDKNKEIL